MLFNLKRMIGTEKLELEYSQESADIRIAPIGGKYYSRREFANVCKMLICGNYVDGPSSTHGLLIARVLFNIVEFFQKNFD